MKLKTSITLSEDLVKAIDRCAGKSGNRSAFIERAVRIFLSQKDRDENNARDLQILNREAERLNGEASDVLEYQEMR
jgi:metal-responsive CopG/Arc/MetJ family transcriptional regulator